MFLSRWIIGLGWVFWLVILIVVFFVLWLSMGGGTYRFVGLDPLVGDHTQPIDDAWQIHPNVHRRPPVQPTQPAPAQPVQRSDENRNHHHEQTVDATPVIPAAILQRHSQGHPTPAAVYTDQRIQPPANPAPQTRPIQRPRTTTASMLPRRRERPPKLDPRNQAEAICRETLEGIYGVPFLTHYPDWLRNPETGRDLELDCYNPDVGIAVEYNGPQHYKWPNHFPQTREQFLQRIRLDRYKVDACDANGVYLITVPYNVPYHLIPDYIRYYLPEAVTARLQSQQPIVHQAMTQQQVESDGDEFTISQESPSQVGAYSLQAMQEARLAQQGRQPQQPQHGRQRSTGGSR